MSAFAGFVTRTHVWERAFEWDERGAFYLFFLLLSFFLTVGSLWAQGSSGERVLFHAKIFTAEPESPYAEAVSIRGDKIVAVGTLPEVLKSVSAGADRVDLDGKTLFPGFIDSHSHSIDGGLNLIGADATDKVDTLDQLPGHSLMKRKKQVAGARRCPRNSRIAPRLLVAPGCAEQRLQHRVLLRNTASAAARHGRAYGLGESAHC